MKVVPEVICTHNLFYEHTPGQGVLGVSLRVSQGSCFGLLGPNGCGKTTLTGLLVGLERPQKGTFRVLGSDQSRRSVGNLGRMGILLDQSPAYEDLSGWNNAHLTAGIQGLEPEAARTGIHELAELFDLEEGLDRPVSGYSYGMRRKLGLIRVLAAAPDLLVLDEPTAGLDARGAEALAGLVRQRSGQGKTTWISTNDPDWLGEIADEVAFMAGGRIVTQGSPKELIKAVGQTQEVGIEGRGFPKGGFSMEGLLSWTVEGGGFVAVLKDDPALVPPLLESLIKAGATVSSVRIAGPTLRDAFLLATGRSLEE